MDFISTSSKTVNFLSSEIPASIIIFEHEIQTYYLIGAVAVVTVIQSIVVMRGYIKSMK